MLWTALRSQIRHLSTEDIERVRHAFEMGEKAHKDQKRRSGEPFFTHPVTVALSLIRLGADAETIIAALLHDAVEDTPITLEDIRAEFGPTVAHLIDGVTKLDAEMPDKDLSMNDQIENIRKIFTLMQDDVRIIVIKLMDRLHNMNTTEPLPLEKKISLARETSDLYVKIADRLSMQDVRDELEGLCVSILEPALFQALSQLRSGTEENAANIIREMESQMQLPKKKIGTHLTMEYEHKTWQKLHNQLESGNKSVTGLSSYTVVFICPSIDDCYRTMGLLHQVWQREILSFQDFINSPMINGYQGLHTTIILSDGTRIRCKIRTTQMHEYAHRGITLHCFGGASHRGVFSFLPWTERISSLTTDTKNRSQEFWDSLQSDILGDSIVLHGPGDQTVLVPVGTTALDGAFYLFQNEALWTTSIFVDGIAVPFHTKLHHAASLTIELAKRPTFQREWLNWVRTGLATAQIRTALASLSEKKKIMIGKQLLQDIMREQRKGFIEEFKEESLTVPIAKLGYTSLQDVYIAIANGHLDPAEAIAALFRMDAPVRQAYIFHFSLHPENVERTTQLTLVQETYQGRIEQTRYHYKRSRNGGAVRIKASLTPQEQRSFLSELKAAGAGDASVEPIQSAMLRIFGLAALIILWGLDPVFARAILRGTVDAFDLTLIRFSTLFIAASIGIVIQRYKYQKSLKWLSPLKPSLLLSGIAIYFTALFSYITLTYISATQYILFIVAGLILVKLWHALRKRNTLGVLQLIIGMVMLVFSIVMLARSEGSPLIAIMMAIGSSIGFVIYSKISKRYLEETEVISIRYPTFLFWVSFLGCILSVLLLPFGTTQSIPLSELSIAVLFVLIFSAIPYFLYFEAQRRIRSIFLDRALPFVILANIAGEVMMTRSLVPLFVLPVLVAFLVSYLLYVSSVRKAVAL